MITQIIVVKKQPICGTTLRDYKLFSLGRGTEPIFNVHEIAARLLRLKLNIEPLHVGHVKDRVRSFRVY